MALTNNSTIEEIAEALGRIIEKKKVKQQIRSAVLEFEEKTKYAKYVMNPIDYMEVAALDEEQVKSMHRNIKLVVQQLQERCTHIEVGDGVKLRLNKVHGTSYWLREDEFGQTKMVDSLNGIQHPTIATFMDVQSARKWQPKISVIGYQRIQLKMRLIGKAEEYCLVTLELVKVLPL